MTVTDIDLNLVVDADRQVHCRHCGEHLGDASTEPLANARVHERPSVQAGPGIHVDPATLTDRPIVVRQTFCPQCLTLLATEIVPADEPSRRKWSLA